MIEFRLAPRSGVATYLQLQRQVRHAIRLGHLRPGDRLPTAKEVVRQLVINPNTVLKAYRELERDGLVEGRPGLGTFVVGDLAGPSIPELAALRRRLGRWLDSARAAGLTDDDVDALIETARRDLARDEVA
jgi:GntR family transcriptional regulator